MRRASKVGLRRRYTLTAELPLMKRSGELMKGPKPDDKPRLCVTVKVDMASPPKPWHRPGSPSLIRGSPQHVGEAGAAGKHIEADDSVEDRMMFRAECDALFRGIDKDGNGRLTQKEIKSGLAAIQAQTGVIRAAKEVWKAADKDGSKLVDHDEFFKFMSSHQVTVDSVKAAVDMRVEAELASLPPDFMETLSTKVKNLTVDLENCVTDHDSMALVARGLQWMRLNEFYVASLGGKNESVFICQMVDSLMSALGVAR